MLFWLFKSQDAGGELNESLVGVLGRVPRLEQSSRDKVRRCRVQVLPTSRDAASGTRVQSNLGEVSQKEGLFENGQK
jgi:hypothetical protein